MRVAVVLVATTVIDINPEDYKDIDNSIPSFEDAAQLFLESTRDNPEEFLGRDYISVDVHIQEIHD